MKPLKQLLRIAALGAGLALASGGHAQPAAPEASATAGPAATASLAEGEVRKIDKENGKITLKHGEIRNLDMPAMTMVFRVSDVSMLDKVKAGDKVRFAASSEGGKLTVTQIEATN